MSLRREYQQADSAFQKAKAARREAEEHAAIAQRRVEACKAAMKRAAQVRRTAWVAWQAERLASESGREPAGQGEAA